MSRSMVPLVIAAIGGCGHYGMGDGLTYSCSKFAGLCASPIVKRSLCLLHETPQY